MKSPALAGISPENNRGLSPVFPIFLLMQVQTVLL